MGANKVIKSGDSIELLERQYVMPRTVSADTEIVVGNEGFLYRAVADDISVEGQRVSGKCILEKYRKIISSERVIKSIIPFRTESRARSSYELSWRVRNYYGDCTFINWGGKIDGRNDYNSVRYEMVASLSKVGVIVSDALLDTILAPLEQKLLQIKEAVHSIASTLPDATDD